MTIVEMRLGSEASCKLVVFRARQAAAVKAAKLPELS